VDSEINLKDYTPKGVKTLKDFSASPDPEGVLKNFKVNLPDFQRGCYFSTDVSDRWPFNACRILPWVFKESLKDLSELTYLPRSVKFTRNGEFLILQLKDDNYLAILPIAGKKAMSWLYVNQEGELSLKLGNLGDEKVEGDIPLFAWARSPNLYTACREAWEKALNCKQIQELTKLRQYKDYPEAFRHLGWCTWEEYKRDINEKLLVDVFNKIEQSDIPIKYIIIDNGHVDSKDGDFNATNQRKLMSFEPNERFPHNWEKIMDFKKDDGIKWFGVWHNFNGYWYGIHPQNNLGLKINEHLEPPCPDDNYLLPKRDYESAEIFYDAFMKKISEYGFDFVKIDWQTRNLLFYSGCKNAVQGNHYCSQALENAVNKHLNGMINCMSLNLPCIFNTRYSSSTRSSMDYKVGLAIRGKYHIYQSFHNALWLCQTVWGDHDMFHSSDTAAGRIMAVSKSMSGGPIYLSDAPEDFISEYIMPMCYEDGELIRPLAPGVNLPKTAFVNPILTATPYSVVAPLSNNSASIVLYNLYKDNTTITASVTPEDYSVATGMIQPYPGEWDLPKEGLIIYDWYSSKAEKLDKEYSVSLRGFSDRLVHLCPIKNGWSVIGRIDKYLSPATVKNLFYKKNELKFTLKESGPFGIWSEKGNLTSEDVELKSLGNGLWIGEMPVGKRNVTVKISRL
jgi:hypothetical protein